MFEKIRRPGRGKAVTAYVVFGAICLVFVFFGVAPTQLGFQRGGAAAVINNHQITQADYQRRVEAMERQYSQQLQVLPEAQRQLQMNQLRAQALEQLVETELLYQTASQEGFVITDAEIRDFLVNVPAFQENGRFRRDLYTQYLQSMGYTPGQFEDQLRKDLIVDKVRNLFLTSIQPVKGERERSQVLAGSRLNLDVVQFSQKSLEQALKVSDQDVSAFLTNEESLAKATERYESSKAQYQRPEQVRARHILISNADPQAETKLKEVLERIKTEDFARVAEEVSDDPGSAEQGGDLGYFSRGRMVEEFENAAFSQEVGVVGQPVTTSYGTHIIKVEDKKPMSTISFDEVKNDIAKSMLVQPKIEETMSELRKLVTASNVGELNKKLADLGWKWEETGPFALTASYIPKVGENEALISAVAKNPQAGQLVPELVSAGGDYFVVKVKSVELASPTADSQGETEQMSQFFTLRRAGEVFSNWLESAKGDARIQRNSQLLVN